MRNRLGRLLRKFDPRVPHMAAARMMPGLRLPPLSKEVHHLTGYPDLGVMGNDEWGDCTIAALGHAEQLWTEDASGAMVTVPDACVLQAYHEATGCDITAGPGNPTDAGGNEQDVLTWATNVGMPQADGSRRKLLGFVEVDPRNLTDVCEAIQETGLVYIGFNVPNLLPEDPGSRWTGGVDLGPIEGGHCVILTGFDRGYGGVLGQSTDDVIFDVESWGSLYTMDRTFWERYVDEAYALLSPLAFRLDSTSPWGMTLAQVEQLMAAIRQP